MLENCRVWFLGLGPAMAFGHPPHILRAIGMKEIQMEVTKQDTNDNALICGQCQAHCSKESPTCDYCGKPICTRCLVEYNIRSRTHDGLIQHHEMCDEKSSARNFRI
jgi:uncharacterized paraquat-inducible protein A